MTASKSDDNKQRWGRAYTGDWLSAIIAFLMMAATPFVVLLFIVCISHYKGELTAEIKDLVSFLLNPRAVSWSELTWLPTWSNKALFIYVCWFSLQFVLAVFLPSPTGPKPFGFGQETPAGHVLPYKVNGLRAWVVTHILWVIAVFYLKLFNGGILYDHWPALFLVCNAFGWCLTVFAYIKAHVAPSHPDDCKFSGSILYDLFMGIELNPRFGDWFDFKLFFNGRPGIVWWSIINLSMACKQYELYGYVTNSMIALNILHQIYILDFFWNESWYLRTIDIAHDHFGFYLAWGDTTWLPWLYPLQSYYLVVNPVDLSTPFFVFTLVLGFAGYFIFRSVNSQKDYFRAKKGDCKIWGKPAQYILCEYKTADGQTKESTLLVSGWWGLSRHFNYVGDLMMSLSFCLTCGFQNLLPYFYIIYMTILLVHRVERDNSRLSMKYGANWEKYCKRVPYKILPYVY